MRPIWTPENWEDGYYDNKTRFRVYRPDYPRAWNYKTTKGYAFRSHIVWWLHTGEVVPKNCVLHHKNGNHKDDSFDNLEVMLYRDHMRLHYSNSINTKCAFCAAAFTYKPSRPRKFCSVRCAGASRRGHKRSAHIVAKVANGVRLSKQLAKENFMVLHG